MSKYIEGGKLTNLGEGLALAMRSGNCGVRLFCVSCRYSENGQPGGSACYVSQYQEVTPNSINQVATIDLNDRHSAEIKYRKQAR